MSSSSLCRWRWSARVAPFACGGSLADAAGLLRLEEKADAPETPVVEPPLSPPSGRWTLPTRSAVWARSQLLRPLSPPWQPRSVEQWRSAPPLPLVEGRSTLRPRSLLVRSPPWPVTRSLPAYSEQPLMAPLTVPLRRLAAAEALLPPSEVHAPRRAAASACCLSWSWYERRSTTAWSLMRSCSCVSPILLATVCCALMP
mmetsp:Transcript_25152/g.73621  ORF Transcript_25152/g.73621 Transcript_25152/m.73621 type:complete len:200 (+) Transcript_25152:516-1115(+)